MLDWELDVGSFFFVRAALRNSVTVGRPSFVVEGVLLPVVALAFGIDCDSRVPLALGSNGDGALSVREETGSRKGAMRNESWGSSRWWDSSRGLSDPLESML